MALANNKIIIGDSKKIWQKKRGSAKALQFFEFNKNEEGNYKLYDRFSFDNFFRLLLTNNLNHNEALDFILGNCSLSALVFQERIHNKYYLHISTEELVSEDLITMRDQILTEKIIAEIEEEINRPRK